MLLVAGGIFFVVWVMLRKLLPQESHTPTARGIKFAVVLFGAGILLGVLMILALTGILNVNYALLLKGHLHLLLFGWIATLIASVAFQVIEMFFVTPLIPSVMRKTFPSF